MVVVVPLSAVAQQTSNAYVMATGAAAPGLIRANTDYYTIYVDGVCINHDNTWLTRNLISVTAHLEVNGKAIDVPVFSGQARESCKIATAHQLLISSVPSTNPVLKLGVDIKRYDTKDFMKRVLNLVN